MSDFSDDGRRTPPIGGGDDRIDSPQSQLAHDESVVKDSSDLPEGAIQGTCGVTLKNDPQLHGWQMPEKVNYDAVAPLDQRDYVSRTKYEPTKNLEEDGSYKIDKALEEMLYSADARQTFGKFIQIFKNVNCEVFGRHPKTLNGGFIRRWEDPRIDPSVRENIMRLKWVSPFPVQFISIPYILEGVDVMSAAQTGTFSVLDVLNSPADVA